MRIAFDPQLPLDCPPVAQGRRVLREQGGQLGTDGWGGFRFRHGGQIVCEPGTDETKVREAAIDAGADDVVTHDDGSVEVITGPYDFVAVKDALAAKGFEPEFAEVTMKPAAEIDFSGDDAARMQKLLDALEAIDDVQDVYTTAVIENA